MNAVETWVQINDNVYFCDSITDMADAKLAMDAAGIAELPVFVGDPDSPDTHKNGQILFAK